MTLKRRKILLVVSVVIFSVLAATMILYGKGYSLGNGFKLTKNGGLYIAAPYENTDIFINGKNKKTTSIFSQGLFLSGLKPGEYSVLVAKPGMWPWAKTLRVEEGKVTESRSFLAPQNTNGDFLLKGKFLNLWASPSEQLLVLEEQKNSNFHLVFYQPNENNLLSEDAISPTKLLTFKNRVANLMWGQNYLIFKNEKDFVKVDFNLSAGIVTAKKILPDQIDQDINQNNNYERTTTAQDIKIWWNPVSNEIYADWLKEDSEIPYYLCGQKPCQQPFQIFKSRLPIKNIDFFPQRKDVIIMAIDNGIYALEMDKKGQQNFQSIYKGKDPTFGIIKGENYLYVLDDGSLMKIDIKNKL